MYHMILFTQWKAVRLPLAVATVLAFALPILSVRTAQTAPGPFYEASHFLLEMAEWSIWYPLLAGALGLLLAVTAWIPDNRLGHVYARTLPVARWRYVLLRLAAAFTLLAPPVVLLLLGAGLATGVTAVPTGMSAYPVALAVRFAFAGGVALAMFFAISAGSARTAGLVLAGLAVLLVAQAIATMSANEIQIVDPMFQRLVEWPSPLMIFRGRWMLIDV